MTCLQVLVATMGQTDISKYHEMNIRTDAIFANQTDWTDYCKQNIGSCSVEMISTQTRGVGRNRNIALSYASGDIVLMSDEDLRYVDDYENMVLNAFDEIRDADAIIFNITTIGRDSDRRTNQKSSRVHFFNAFNYSTPRIAVKLSSIRREGIFFNENFGGGTMYSCGEDTLFIRDMLKHGLKIYTHPANIAVDDATASSWFTGYNEKYFYDKGALFCAINDSLCKPLLVQDYIRHKNLYKGSGLAWRTIYSLELKGAEGFKKLLPFAADQT